MRPDPRLEMQKKALDVAQRYEQEAKERLRRINIVAAGLETVGTKKPNRLDSSGIDEAWYDDAQIPGQFVDIVSQ